MCEPVTDEVSLTVSQGLTGNTGGSVLTSCCGWLLLDF